MCMDKDEILDRQSRVLSRKRFLHDLYIMVARGSLYIGVYRYKRPISTSDLIVVFKVARGVSYERKGVIEAIADAAQKYPILLSRQETSDYVASFRSETGVNNKLSAGVLQVMMLDVTHPKYADTTGSKKFLCSDIKLFSIQGNNFND